MLSYPHPEDRGFYLGMDFPEVWIDLLLTKDRHLVRHAKQR